MKRLLRRPGPSQITKDALFRSLKVGGVAQIGGLRWTTYPKSTYAVAPFGSGVSGTRGSLVTLVPAGSIAAPSYLVGASIQGPRYGQLYFESGAQVAVVMPMARYVSIPPARIAASQALQVAVGHDSTASSTVYVMGLLFLGPHYPSFAGIQTAYSAAVNVLPTTSVLAGPVVPASASTYGSYVQLTAGIANDILVTGVNISTVGQTYGQFAFASGGAGSETDWGEFPCITTNIGSVNDADHIPLWPFPLLVPANTRLAVRAQSRLGIAGYTFRAGLEYVNLPL